MSISTINLIFVLLTASTYAFQDIERGIEVIALNARSATAGGWGLAAAVCPTTAQTCEGYFCCPFELECVHNGNGNHCCPPGTNCLAAYQSSPQCADDSWSLWKAKSDATHGYFCCLPGMIGTNAGTCVTSNTPVVSSLSASLLSSATGVAASASTVKSSASAASKVTSSASQITSSVTSATSNPAQASASSGSQSSTTSSQAAQQTVKSGADGKALAHMGELIPIAVLAGAFAAII